MSKTKTGATLMTRAVNFLRHEANRAWSDIVCNLKGAELGNMSLLLLAATYFKMFELTERQARNGNHFQIQGFSLQANKLQKVLEKDSQGRTRFIRVWVDSALGGPDPRIRLGTTNGSVTATGVRLTPGVSNEIGNIPDTTELYMMSDVAINIFVVEEA